MADLQRLNDEAHAAGVDPLPTVIGYTDDLRSQALKQWPEGIEATVKLTHAIWWLSRLKEEVTA